MSNFNIGKGITITTGFDLGSNQPLDARTVVDNLNKLKELPDSIIYPGLMVFVIDQNKLYQYKEIIEEDKDPYMGWGPKEFLPYDTRELYLCRRRWSNVGR